ncbi:MAG: hypothetical protein K9L31_02960, partial [Candidatus Pacebacteria bacterium]|nr:hypothetical protein [Candidatus Paceibacterota bacterium]
MSPKLLNILLIVTSVVLYIYVISPIYSGGDSIFFEQGQDIKGLIDTRNSHDKVIEIIPSIIKQ